MYLPNQLDGALNVLLAEDNEADATLALKAIECTTVKVNLYIVDDGEQAIDFIYHQGQFSDNKNPRPDVILLDIHTPKFDGFQVLENLKNNAKTQSIPCVMLTSSWNEEDDMKSYGLGCASYITKPVRYQDFPVMYECFSFYWASVVNKLPSQYRYEKSLKKDINCGS